LGWLKIALGSARESHKGRARTRSADSGATRKKKKKEALGGGSGQAISPKSREENLLRRNKGQGFREGLVERGLKEGGELGSWGRGDSLKLNRSERCSGKETHHLGKEEMARDSSRMEEKSSKVSGKLGTTGREIAGGNFLGTSRGTGIPSPKRVDWGREKEPGGRCRFSCEEGVSMEEAKSSSRRRGFAKGPRENREPNSKTKRTDGQGKGSLLRRPTKSRSKI